jgi:SnoaL-like domain
LILSPGFLSAFAPVATLDFSQPARRFGTEVPVMRGRATIAGILEELAPLGTTHTVTNPRITLDGDRARLAALVEAQHVTKAEPHRRLLLKNTYDVGLSRDGGHWVIDRIVIRTVWHDGDPSALFGAGSAPSSPRVGST